MSATREQHLEALERANEIRMRRAELKRSIKSGDAQVASLLGEELPDWLATMRLGELLESLPRVGPSKAYKIITLVGNVSYTRRLGRLTQRQKIALLHLLAAKEKDHARQRGYKQARLERGVR
jgi:hypothetical protein